MLPTLLQHLRGPAFQTDAGPDPSPPTLDPSPPPWTPSSARTPHPPGSSPPSPLTHQGPSPPRALIWPPNLGPLPSPWILHLPGPLSLPGPSPSGFLTPPNPSPTTPRLGPSPPPGPSPWTPHPPCVSPHIGQQAARDLTLESHTCMPQGRAQGQSSLRCTQVRPSLRGRPSGFQL